MSASRKAYWWERLLHAIPGVTLWCPGYNRHFRWNRVCFCVKNENGWGVLLYCGHNSWVNITGQHAGVLLEGHRAEPFKRRAR